MKRKYVFPVAILFVIAICVSLMPNTKVLADKYFQDAAQQLFCFGVDTNADKIRDVVQVAYGGNGTQQNTDKFLGLAQQLFYYGVDTNGDGIRDTMRINTDIFDPTITDPTDHQVIGYDSASTTWINMTVPSSSFDPTITDPTDHQVIGYDLATTTWINMTIPSSSFDPDIVSPTNNQLVVYDQATTTWMNKDYNLGNLANVVLSNVADNQVLAYDSDTSTWINATGGSGNFSPTITDPETADFITYDYANTVWINSAGSKITQSDIYVPSSAFPTLTDGLLYADSFVNALPTATVIQNSDCESYDSTEDMEADNWAGIFLNVQALTLIAADDTALTNAPDVGEGNHAGKANFNAATGPAAFYAGFAWLPESGGIDLTGFDYTQAQAYFKVAEISGTFPGSDALAYCIILMSGANCAIGSALPIGQPGVGVSQFVSSSFSSTDIWQLHNLGDWNVISNGADYSNITAIFFLALTGSYFTQGDYTFDFQVDDLFSLMSNEGYCNILINQDEINVGSDDVVIPKNTKLIGIGKPILYSSASEHVFLDYDYDATTTINPYCGIENFYLDNVSIKMSYPQYAEIKNITVINKATNTTTPSGECADIWAIMPYRLNIENCEFEYRPKFVFQYDNTVKFDNKSFINMNHMVMADRNKQIAMPATTNRGAIEITGDGNASTPTTCYLTMDNCYMGTFVAGYGGGSYQLAINYSGSINYGTNFNLNVYAGQSGITTLPTNPPGGYVVTATTSSNTIYEDNTDLSLVNNLAAFIAYLKSDIVPLVTPLSSILTNGGVMPYLLWGIGIADNDAYLTFGGSESSIPPSNFAYLKYNDSDGKLYYRNLGSTEKEIGSGGVTSGIIDLYNLRIHIPKYSTGSHNVTVEDYYSSTYKASYGYGLVNEFSTVRATDQSVAAYYKFYTPGDFNHFIDNQGVGVAYIVHNAAGAKANWKVLSASETVLDSGVIESGSGSGYVASNLDLNGTYAAATCYYFELDVTVKNTSSFSLVKLIGNYSGLE